MSDPAKSEDSSILVQGAARSIKAIRDCIYALQRQGSTSTVEASTDPAQDEEGGDASDAPTSQGSASLPVPHMELAPASPPGIDTDEMAANAARSAAAFHCEPEPRVGGAVDDAEETAPIAGSMHSAGAEASGFGGRHERDPLGPAPHGEGVPLDEVSIDPEFSKLIPPLSKEEFALLEHHLLTEGCRDPILVWDDGQRQTVLDGHNRLQICRRHGLRCVVHRLELPDRSAACMWILEHQLGRRNLTPEAYAYLLGKLYHSKKSQRDRTGLVTGHSDQRSTAAERLAAEHHVGEKTIRRHARFAEQLDQLAESVGPDIKHAVLSRDAKITRTDVDRLLKLDSPTRDGIIARVRQGEAAADLIRKARQTGGASNRPPAPAVAARAPESGPIEDRDDGAEAIPVEGAGAGEMPVTHAMKEATAKLVRDIGAAIRFAAEIETFLLGIEQGSIAPDLADCLYDRLAGAVLACSRHRDGAGPEESDHG